MSKIGVVQRLAISGMNYYQLEEFLKNKGFFLGDSKHIWGTDSETREKVAVGKILQHESPIILVELFNESSGGVTDIRTKSCPRLRTVIMYLIKS